MSAPKGYVDREYLDTTAQLMARIKQRSFEMMALKRGQRVLDLGCGPGTDTAALGRVVGSTGEVHGVDYDEAMVALADARAHAEGMGAWVSHHHANATALPWASGFFDASRSERLFQHLLDPERAFDEMVRVTKPDGVLVVIDGDWATLTIDSDETDLERRLVQFHAAHMMNNPFSGRHLHRMFTRRGLQDIRRCAARIPDRCCPRPPGRTAGPDRAGGAGGRRNRHRGIPALGGEPRSRGCRWWVFRLRECGNGVGAQAPRLMEADDIQ